MTNQPTGWADLSVFNCLLISLWLERILYLIRYHVQEKNCTIIQIPKNGDSTPNIYTLGPRPNNRHFSDDIFKCIFLKENVWILIKIPLKFVPRGPINNIPVLVQIMAWRRPGDKSLSKPMMVYLLPHIHASLGVKELTHWGREKMAAISQTTVLNAFLNENFRIRN